MRFFLCAKCDAILRLTNTAWWKLEVICPKCGRHQRPVDRPTPVGSLFEEVDDYMSASERKEFEFAKLLRAGVTFTMIIFVLWPSLGLMAAMLKERGG